MKKTEEKIASLEARDKEIDALLEKEEIFTNLEECTRLTSEKASLSKELEELYEVWGELAE